MLHEAIEQNEQVDFHEMFNPSTKNLFVLQVKGESMIEDQIADGDYVVVQKQRTARKGQIVVALTDEGEATLEALVSREEPHPPGTGQLDDEADLRQGRPSARRGRGSGAESRLDWLDFPSRQERMPPRTPSSVEVFFRDFALEKIDLGSLAEALAADIIRLLFVSLFDAWRPTTKGSEIIFQRGLVSR